MSFWRPIGYLLVARIYESIPQKSLKKQAGLDKEVKKVY
ncbi:hypothetical protein TDIS_1959 [Thermosulfurimonas dismutans]|uniref:Uncharacterized protein n=1 Tax=Thermosulfurimonas dismutans TaxID=999894 RepID=A0A179D1N1_9BACT|nr:hypothetical protein TDIS_1959 [Thermosulfurimonas dismutans]